MFFYWEKTLEKGFYSLLYTRLKEKRECVIKIPFFNVFSLRLKKIESSYFFTLNKVEELVFFKKEFILVIYRMADEFFAQLRMLYWLL